MGGKGGLTLFVCSSVGRANDRKFCVANKRNRCSNARWFVGLPVQFNFGDAVPRAHFKEKRDL